MKSNFLKLSPIVGAFAAIALTGVRAANAADLINIYLSAPNSTTSVFTDTTVETFDTLVGSGNPVPTGNYSSDYASVIGTYQLTSTSQFNVLTDDQYGTGTGQYISLGAQSGTSGPVSLLFNSQQSYFGFSWNAGDANNGLSFYRGSEFLGHYSTATILATLASPTVTAIGGVTQYTSSLYKGKPGSNGNTNGNEPYAFINIIDTNGAFDRVVFDNNNTTGTGYETDNHTIRTVAPTADHTFVAVGSAAIPEAGTVTLIGLGLSAMGILATRRRKA